LRVCIATTQAGATLAQYDDVVNLLSVLFARYRVVEETDTQLVVELKPAHGVEEHTERALATLRQAPSAQGLSFTVMEDDAA
jgi:hypothetical protein